MQSIPTETSAEHAAADGRVAFLLDLSRALHQAGYSTHRLENLLSEMSRRLGIEGQFSAAPTSILAAFGTQHRQRTYMIRTEPRPPNLGRLTRVTDIAKRVLRAELSPSNASAMLLQIQQGEREAPFPALVGYTLASAAAARFFGGGAAEMRVAAVAGLITGILAVIAGIRPRFGRIFEPVAAAACAGFVAFVGTTVGDFSVSIATLAGIIVLIPGLTVTTAVNELAMQHLTAGTTRLAGAFMTFVGIGFGWAIGERIATLQGSPPTVAPIPLPGWTYWVALVAASIAFSLLLRADRRDWLWIVLAAAVATIATRAGTAVLGTELGAFAGAFVIGVFANLFGRVVRRPSPVILVPGLLVMVPGSVGFRGFLALLEGKVEPGIDAGFAMFLTAAALVAGLLSAAAIVPEQPLD